MKTTARAIVAFGIGITAAAAAFGASTPTITGLPVYSEGVSTDAFDVSQGSVVDGSTPTIFPAADAIGGTGGAETSHAIFSDSTPVGGIDYINFHTAAPVTIAGYQALLQDDGTSNNRAAASFKLYSSADNTYSNLTLISSTTISSPYTSSYPASAPTSEIAINDNLATGFPQTTAQFWRIEVTRAINGPRIVEVDAVSAPEPASLCLLGLASAGMLARRRRV